MLRNGLEPWHLLIVALVVILLFGSKKLPDTARALGKSLRILKSETKAMKDEADGTAGTNGTGDGARAGQVVAADRVPGAAAAPGAPTASGAPTAPVSPVGGDGRHP
ncbi:Sec-independent protein translocase subunit TatA [Streptomyces rimosus]|uniref:Sec-independent protein translocase subunit TatA n=1 Tax=Streptomyces rimosus TaxID=1927 RepID=UPI0004CB18C4|nr:Sec-independent protein translocase subunit TatA [Streptomyces rimosus]